MLSHILQAVDWEATKILYKSLCDFPQNINYYSLPEIVHNCHSGMQLCWRQYKDYDMSVSCSELSSLQVVRKISSPTTNFCAKPHTGMEIYVHLTSRKMYAHKEK
jgi:hypothetical protein